MKKFFVLFSAMILLLLAACGNNGSDGGETAKSDGQRTEQQGEDASDTSDDEGDTITQEENEETEAQVGDTVTSEAGETTLVSRTDDVGTFESGPINLTIDKVNGASADLTGDVAEMMETEELEYIQVDMNVDNTFEDNVSFYASQATMTTDTGEQLEPDMLLSEHIDGEFIGEVSKSGTSFYILEDSQAEDVESVRLIYSAASNDDFEDIGDEIDVEVELEQ
ncbi:hypothetical protein SAMN04488072_104104 [Lentibacillus halodurans]|uniref:DUF4352 domain-containing protein n=1 Tax=Lentibacillus halodurans TaxID=237679 RepID=A0A1I0X428_9BACI|nr:hypothetical protein [Lentibacillus halodurans]SFA95130.1 hypothetical protein SAMN04488072_104104 [Lentibacillus halodurans]